MDTMNPRAITSLYGPVSFYYYKGSRRILLLGDLHYKDLHCKDDYHVADWLEDLSHLRPIDIFVESAYWLNPNIRTEYCNDSPLVDLLGTQLKLKYIDLRSIKYLRGDNAISLVSFNHSDELIEKLVDMSEDNDKSVLDISDINIKNCIKYLMCMTDNDIDYHELYLRAYKFALDRKIPSDYLRNYMIHYCRIIRNQWKQLQSKQNFDSTFLHSVETRIDHKLHGYDLFQLDSESIYLLLQELGNIPIHYYGCISLYTSTLLNTVCYAGQNHIDFYRSFIQEYESIWPIIEIENDSNMDLKKANQCIRLGRSFDYFM